MHPLANQVVILTGASSGIGEALALKLGALGARLALAARSVERLDKVVDAITAAGGEAIAVPTDVCVQADCARLVRETEARLGPVQMLINNAGAADQGLTSLLDAQTVNQMMALNVMGPLHLIQAALPGMRARDEGHIVNVVSHAAFHGFALTPAYAMAKAALHAMTLNLSYELVDTHIHVTGIYPGLVDTGFAQAMTPEGGTVPELMSWMRQFRAGLRASEVFKGIEKAQRPAEVADAIVKSLEAPGDLMVFTQQVHADAAARMMSEPRWWAEAAQAFYLAFLPPLRDMMARFVHLTRQDRAEGAKGRR